MRNFTARRHLKEMKKGDRAFFYHTGDEKQVVGIAEVCEGSLSRSDRGKGEPWVVGRRQGGRAAAKPVTLAAVKADKALKDMALVKYARLSVQPVTAAEWKARLQDGRREGLTRDGLLAGEIRARTSGRGTSRSAKGAQGELWTGVRNHTAKLNLMKMKKGDRALLLSFQRRQGDRRHRRGRSASIIPIRPPRRASPGWWSTSSARRAVPKPVTLAAVKAEPRLKDMALVKYSRLSVQPVTAEEWKLVCKMGGMKAVSQQGGFDDGAA